MRFADIKNDEWEEFTWGLPERLKVSLWEYLHGTAIIPLWEYLKSPMSTLDNVPNVKIRALYC